MVLIKVIPYVASDNVLRARVAIDQTTPVRWKDTDRIMSYLTERSTDKFARLTPYEAPGSGFCEFTFPSLDLVDDFLHIFASDHRVDLGPLILWKTKGVTFEQREIRISYASKY